MKKIIHVNQHIIKRNRETGANDPVITVKTYESNNYAHDVQIDGPSKIVYCPNKPLSCGARVWIETTSPVHLNTTASLATEKQSQQPVGVQATKRVSRAAISTHKK